MLANRFRESRPFLETVPSAFVACPFIACMTPIQFAQMEYLYRVAYEQAHAQLATPAAPRIPAFSVN